MVDCRGGISPDLRNEKDKQITWRRPLHQRSSRWRRQYADDLAVSPHSKDELWAGSDDGLVHLTRDGGKTWKTLRRKEWKGIVNSIESPFMPGKTYLTLMRYKIMDLKPIKTDGYGQKWERISDGIEDPAPLFVWFEQIKKYQACYMRVQKQGSMFLKMMGFLGKLYS